ncbi:MAG: hypothetical protein AAFY99_03830 [Pseudomonadota bacterium]
MKKLLLAMIAIVWVVPNAGAETGRYILEKTDNGYVRMDTQTGDMALCAEADGQMICRAAADERAAFQQQLDALDARIDRLEKALAAGLSALPRAPSAGLPDPSEFEQGLDYMEQFFNRFRGIIEDTERSTQ